MDFRPLLSFLKIHYYTLFIPNCCAVSESRRIFVNLRLRASAVYETISSEMISASVGIPNVTDKKYKEH